MAASSRLESLFSRIYSSVLAVLHVEVVANAFFQSQYLGPGKWLMLIVVTIPILGMIAHAWLRGRLGLWAYLHGITVLLAIWSWPLLILDPSTLPSDFQAWVWWLIGTATISMGVVNPTWLGFLYLFVASGSWYLLDTSSFGGSSNPVIALQDSIYVFLLGGAVSALVRLTRQGAKRADEANSVAIENAIQLAQVDATERERQRIDALVHDRVLNTLLVAAKAQSAKEQNAAAVAAAEAITSLQSAFVDQNVEARVTTLGLYRSLRKAATRASSRVQVVISSAGLEDIPAEVAQAVTEATLQAIDNAVRHSGSSEIRVQLGGDSVQGLLVQVSDSGKGFVIERLPKDRLGIRTSIEARMRLAGGEATILSEIGQGTKVQLRWAND